MTKQFNRRSLLALAGTALAAPFAGRAAAAEAKKLRLGRDAIVINGLGGVYDINATDWSAAEMDDQFIGKRILDDMRASGMTAVSVSIMNLATSDHDFQGGVRNIGWLDAAIRRYPDYLMKVYSTKDILEAKKTGRTGVIYNTQFGGEMIGDDLSRLDIFADLGLRIFAPTYNFKNNLGSGCLAPGNEGLTELGREAIARAQKNRLLIDLAHANERTTHDAIEAASGPIAITHTACAALGPSPRNKTDEELRKLADKSGLVGIYFMPFMNPGRQHFAEDVANHIEHAVNICGEDHVGIGTDGGTTTADDIEGIRARQREQWGPPCVEDCIDYPKNSPDFVLFTPDMQGPDQFRILAALLKSRGYKSARIEKILGGNFLRLFGEVWA